MIDLQAIRVNDRGMTKKAFVSYYSKILKAKTREELATIIAGLMHEQHCEPKDALFNLAMANKRIIYNLDYFDTVEKAAPAKSKKS